MSPDCPIDFDWASSLMLQPARQIRYSTGCIGGPLEKPARVHEKHYLYVILLLGTLALNRNFSWAATVTNMFVSLQCDTPHLYCIQSYK